MHLDTTNFHPLDPITKTKLESALTTTGVVQGHPGHSLHQLQCPQFKGAITKTKLESALTTTGVVQGHPGHSLHPLQCPQFKGVWSLIILGFIHGNTRHT